MCVFCIGGVLLGLYVRYVVCVWVCVMLFFEVFCWVLDVYGLCCWCFLVVCLFLVIVRMLWLVLICCVWLFVSWWLGDCCVVWWCVWICWLFVMLLCDCLLWMGMMCLDNWCWLYVYCLVISWLLWFWDWWSIWLELLWVWIGGVGWWLVWLLFCFVLLCDVWVLVCLWCCWLFRCCVLRFGMCCWFVVCGCCDWVLVFWVWSCWCVVGGWW